MQILITGGTGFIGRALCLRLRQKNHHLTVLSRHPDKVKALCGPSVNAISDLREILKLQEIDIIINLAGEPIINKRWSIKQKRILMDSRVNLTSHVVRRIQSLFKKPKLLINASAVGFYGDHGNEIIDENTLPHQDFAHHLCEAWESQANHAANYGTRVCILRLAPVLGLGGGFLGKMLPAFKLGLGGKIGDGKQWMPWIHLDDLLNIMEFLISHEELDGIFNAVAPHPVTNEEFTKTLAHALHRPAIFNIPNWLVKQIFGERAILLLNSNRVIPKRLLDAGFEFKYQELAKALDNLLAVNKISKNTDQLLKTKIHH